VESGIWPADSMAAPNTPVTTPADAREARFRQPAWEATVLVLVPVHQRCRSIFPRGVKIFIAHEATGFTLRIVYLAGWPCSCASIHGVGIEMKYFDFYALESGWTVDSGLVSALESVAATMQEISMQCCPAPWHAWIWDDWKDVAS
jgi:hypothetical protein